MRPGVILGLLFISFLYIFSCRTVTIKRKMYPELYRADSAYLMYYSTPGNPRFFKIVKLTDTAAWQPLVNNVNGNIIDSLPGCITEGKVYFYEGPNAVHTAYFSRLKGCRALYFIKTGVKYFTKMNDDVSEWLDKMEETAIEMKSAVKETN